VADVDVSPEAYRKHLLKVKSTATAEKYVPAVEIFLNVVRQNGYTNFEELPRGLLSQYVDALVEQDYAPSSIGVYIAGIKGYLKWVANQGVKVAPLSDPETPRVIASNTREALAPNLLGAFFHAADRLLEPGRSAVMLLPCTGLRAQEMMSLPLSSIRTVELTLEDGVRKRAVALRVEGKGGRIRTVPLLDEGVPILTGYLTGYRRNLPGPWVFPGKLSKRNRKGQLPIGRRTLDIAINEVREALGIHFTPHTMRRTYITGLYRRGVPLATLAKIAGHASIQTLFRHYIAIDEQDVTRDVHRAGATII
jgi:integrase/recombinase XerD